MTTVDLSRFEKLFGNQPFPFETVEGFPVLAPELSLQNDGFEPEMFAYLAEVESWYFWFQVRNQLIAWSLERDFPNVRNFLEVGCGNGNVLSAIQRKFPQLEIYGSEIYLEGLKFARERIPEATLFQADARQFPFENQFDVIGSFDVLEHITEDEEVLANFFKALKPRGGLLIAVPQHPFLWSPSDEYVHHKRRYTSSELLGKLQRAGFRIERSFSFVSLLLPLVILSRISGRLFPRQFDPKQEFRISPTVNILFKKIMQAELTLIQAGINFPAGTSLYAIARKPG